MSATEARPGSLQTGWKIAGVALLILLAFGPSIAGPFHFDSKAAILTEARRDTARERLSRRPTRALTTASFLASEQLFGLRPGPWRLTNLALHGLVTALLIAFARELGIRSQAAVAGGLLFAVHPLAGSAVLPVVQRSELLCAAFLLAMMIAWRRARSRSADQDSTSDGPTAPEPTPRLRWFAAAGVAALAAMASKEVGAVAPLLLLVLELTRERSEGEPRLRPGALAAIGAGVLIVVALVVSRDVPSTVLDDPSRAGLYWLTQGRSLVWLLSRAVWPVGLSVDPGGRLATHLLDPGWLGHLAILGGLAALARWGSRRSLTLAALAFVVTWPSSSLIPLPDPCFEHRAYLPLGLLLLALAGSESVQSRLSGDGRRQLLVGWVVAMVVLIGLSNLRSRAWRSELALWWRAMSARGLDRAHPRALVSLGVIVLREGIWRVGSEADPVPARARDDGALETCPELTGGRPVSEAERASALAPGEHARRLFDRALASQPSDPEASRALVNRSLCRLAEAEAARTRIPRLQTELRSLAARGELESAAGARRVAELEQAAEAVRSALAAAEADLRLALKRRPDSTVAYNNLGRLQLRTGRVDEAKASFREALERDPRSGEARVGLGDVLRSQGRTDEAAACYQAALPRLSGRRRAAAERRLRELTSGSER